jgi:hypothetical protein
MTPGKPNTLCKKANIIKKICDKKTVAHNIKNRLKYRIENEDRRTQEETNAWKILPGT